MSAPGTAIRSRPAVGSGPAPVSPPGRQRQRPWIVLGVLLVVGCSLAFALAALRIGDRRPVLVVARAVPAGQVLADADLAEVRIAAGEGVRPVPGSQRSQVVGRTAAVPLLAGSLLTMEQVGPASTLAAGDAVVGLALKPGQFPPGLAPGARVRVIDAGGPSGSPSPTTSGDAAVARSAMVLAVSAPGVDGSATTVVSVKTSSAEADRVVVASAAGRAALVLLPPS